MACALTTGIALDCKTAIGGVKSVRFTSLANYLALSGAVSGGQITAFGSASTVFFKYDQLKETSSLTDTFVVTRSTGGLHYTPSVTVVLSKMATNKRNEIKLLAQNLVVAIVETHDTDANGNFGYWVVGAANGLDLMEGSGATGTAAADLNGYTLKFDGIEPEQIFKLAPTSGTIAAMLASITSSTQITS